MKNIITGIALIILIFILINFNTTANKFIEISEKFESYVGEYVVLEQDTLLIIDYSFNNSTVTLTDGRKISTNLVEKLILINNE